PPQSRRGRSGRALNPCVPYSSPPSMETSADHLLGERIEHLSHAVITKCRLTDTDLSQIAGSQIGWVRGKRTGSAWERERVALVEAPSLVGDAGAKGEPLQCIKNRTTWGAFLLILSGWIVVQAMKRACNLFRLLPVA